jgi:hypothetical protein
MAEAGVTGAPKRGDMIVVSLVGKKQVGQGLNPANLFRIQYTPAAGAEGAQQPVQAEAVTAPAAPVPAPQQVAQPAPVAAPQMPQAPVTQGVAVPPDFNAEQAALLQQLNGAQQA